MKKYSKGFTLIELLVVIAIIGILSSVVLASLNTARNKGSDAAAKAGMAQLRNQAELFYDGPGNYTGMWASTTAIMANVVQNSNGVATGSDAQNWAAGATLKGTGVWCVDSTGASKSITTIITAGTTVCPAS
jgi:prepilin-type N-terminal cleavage/methylation domain-containing protein